MQHISRLDPAAEAVGLARGQVRAVLSPAAPPEVTETAVLLVSELVTNAVKFGAGSEITLVVDIREPVRVEIHDAIPGTLPKPRGSVEEPGGRGLLLVDRLADSWGVEPTHAGKSVWFELSASRRRRRRGATDPSQAGATPAPPGTAEQPGPVPPKE